MNFQKIMFRLVYIKWILRDRDQNEYRQFWHFFLTDLVVIVVGPCIFNWLSNIRVIWIPYTHKNNFKLSLWLCQTILLWCCYLKSWIELAAGNLLLVLYWSIPAPLVSVCSVSIWCDGIIGVDSNGIMSVSCQYGCLAKSCVLVYGVGAKLGGDW